MKLVISGAVSPPEGALLPYRLVGELHKNHYGGAILWLLEAESGIFTDYFRPAPADVERFAHRAPPGPMNLDRFTGLYEWDGRLYVTTFNEVLVIDKVTRQLVDAYSQPSFNDLHCCLAYEKGHVVANTGMDCIEVFDPEWRQIDRVRFEEQRDIDGKDWRHVPSTKPHRCHINWLFLLDGEVWCTRHANRDAVQIYDHRKRMLIDCGKPHDGIVANGHVVFTTSNGMVLSHERNGAHKHEVVVDLERVLGASKIGWVRGLYSDSDDLFVGTTRLRRTTSREVVDWIRSRPRNDANSAIIQIRASDKRVIAIREAPSTYSVIFSILRL
jgi:hypothetical protein